MLQQTRVEVVRDAFTRFVQRFPTPAEFAEATDDELQQTWRGLGYYRRARLLRDGARQVVDRHAGQVPDDIASIRALAGVGDYTGGAIASIAFGRVEAAIDGNVERVFARHAAIADDVKRSPTRARIRGLILERIDRGRPGDFNQALMDLGAMVCTPRNPGCVRCPVAVDCEARLAGLQDALPKLPARRAALPIAARAVLVVDSDGAVLASRIPAGQINQGQLELPTPGILVDLPDDAEVLGFALAQRFGVRFEVGAPVAAIRHAITHHRITFHIHLARVLGPTGTLCFVSVADPAAPWSTPSRKALHAVAGGGQHTGSASDRPAPTGE